MHLVATLSQDDSGKGWNFAKLPPWISNIPSTTFESSLWRSFQWSSTRSSHWENLRSSKERVHRLTLCGKTMYESHPSHTLVESCAMCVASSRLSVLFHVSIESSSILDGVFGTFSRASFPPWRRELKRNEGIILWTPPRIEDDDDHFNVGSCDWAIRSSRAMTCHTCMCERRNLSFEENIFSLVPHTFVRVISAFLSPFHMRSHRMRCIAHTNLPQQPFVRIAKYDTFSKDGNVFLVGRNTTPWLRRVKS